MLCFNLLENQGSFPGNTSDFISWFYLSSDLPMFPSYLLVCFLSVRVVCPQLERNDCQPLCGWRPRALCHVLWTFTIFILCWLEEVTPSREWCYHEVISAACAELQIGACVKLKCTGGLNFPAVCSLNHLTTPVGVASSHTCCHFFHGWTTR